MKQEDKTIFAIVGLAQMLLIGLRLGSVIDWHWGWVLSPTLFCVGLFILIVLMAMFIALIQDY